MQFVLAFVVGGLIGAVGQLVVDATPLTPAHVMVLSVVVGAVLTGLGLYEPLVKLAGAGATTPVTNFGFVLTKGVMDHLGREGLFGVLSGIFEVAGAVIGAAILIGFAVALLFQPKG